MAEIEQTKPKDKRAAFVRLVQYLKPHKSSVAIGIASNMGLGLRMNLHDERANAYIKSLRDYLAAEIDDPAFANYLGEAFKPLGVYLNFFQPTLPAGAPREFTVMLINDEGRPLAGELALTLETKAGKALARAQKPFALAERGAQTLQVPLALPDHRGECILKATAQPDRASRLGPTVSRRWLSLGQ